MKTENIKALNQLRWVGIAEGISFLILLLIAMPLKYKFGNPLPVKYTGWAHGVLFMLYLLAVVNAALRLRWSFLRIALFFIASFIPLATFFLDRN